jgi:GTP pyrophosphokinase
MGEALRSLNFDTYDDFLASVGYGKTTPAALVSRLAPDLRPEEKSESRLKRVVKRALGVGSPQIEVQGVGDVMVALAQCCAPIPGEDIVGYITRGRGVSVHAAACRNVQNLLYGSDRRMEVAWSRKKKAGAGATHPVRVRVLTDDKQGVLARIASVISEEGTNIKTVDARVSEDRQGTILLVLDITDTKHLDRVLRRLKTVEGIRHAERHVE